MQLLSFPMTYPTPMKLALLVSLLLAAVPARAADPAPAPSPRPLVPNGAWAPNLIAHPRLLGSRADLQALAKAKPEAYRRLASLKGNLLATGIVHAVDGAPAKRIRPFIAEAMENVRRGPTNAHQDSWIWMEQVALTFDLFHDQIPAAERQQMIAWLNANLASFTTDENAFHNSTLSKIFCYLRIAYGTWGENPRASDFRNHALLKLYEGKVLPVLLEFGAGGGYTECGWYARGSLWHLVQAMELARRFEGYDGFQKAPDFYYQRLAYEMFQPYPGLGQYAAERYACEGDGVNVYGGFTEYPRHLRTVLAQYFRGSQLAAAVANLKRTASNPQTGVTDFLIEEPADPPLDLKTFPLAHIAAGIGKVYARSDWTDSATWLRFECGDYWTQHQHFEAGNFEIFRYAPLATESGEYTDWTSPHATNWLIRTVAHNCILVYQPDEPWHNNRRPPDAPYANDGGQAGINPTVVDTLPEWMAQRSKFQRGKIVAYDNRPQFLYVAGDCTAAYAPSKVSLCRRHLLFIRPGTFIILDYVTSTRPEYEKTWLLHSHNEPQVSGSAAQITNGPGHLFVQTLLPQAPVIEKIEGYTYRGQTYEAARSNLTAAANLWRIEVRPSAPAREDLFLHILSTEAAPQAQLLRDNNRVGARGDGWEVLFNAEGTGSVTLAGQTYPLEMKVR